MNTQVDFQTAKLLKEKGFKNPSITYYDKENNLETYKLCYCQIYSTAWHQMVSSRYLDIDIYSAPTIAEVVMWFYEKHGIWISIEQNTYEDKFDYLITQRNEDSSWFVVGNDEKIIKSPTEAYEAAIEYTLKHLI